jgi:Sigma-70 region 3
MIDTINKIVRTSRQMLHGIGREPTPEELAEKLGMPLEKVRKVLKIAKEPISLPAPCVRPCLRPCVRPYILYPYPVLIGRQTISLAISMICVCPGAQISGPTELLLLFVCVVFPSH